MREKPEGCGSKGRREFEEMKPEKLAFVLPVAYQTQFTETGTESLQALYSDGWQSEKTVGYVPNRPS